MEKRLPLTNRNTLLNRNIIRDLYNRLEKESDFLKRYPNFKLNDGKIHILYLSPLLNETGYYRFIAPALELENTTTHSAIISNIHKWDYNKTFDDYDTPIDARLVDWAHYIIIPAMLTSISYLINTLKKINDTLEFFMDIDMNYFRIAEGHPHKTTRKQLLTLIENISKANGVLCANQNILEDVDNLLSRHFPNEITSLEYTPAFISDYAYRDIPQIRKNNTDKIRIGIVGDPAIAADVEPIINVIKQIMEKYKDKAELILFGWNGFTFGKNLFKDIPFVYESPVGLFGYFKKLNDLTLDIALIPVHDLLYNATGKSFVRYLEHAHNETVVIASNISPYKEIIINGENGFLAETEKEWLDSITLLIEDNGLRTSVGQYAHKFVWENLSYTRKNLKIFTSIFY